MKLKPWYDVVKPCEDLREGKPLDASEFAVHLDKVRRRTTSCAAGAGALRAVSRVEQRETLGGWSAGTEEGAGALS